MELVHKAQDTGALLDELSSELKKCFKGLKVGSAEGLKEPAVYMQRLPISDDDDDDELAYAPYVLVILSDFKIEDWSADKKIKVILVFCSYDNAQNRQGHRDNLLMMENVLERLGKHPYIGNYSLEMPIEGAWQDKDTFPFFYGAVELNFSATKYITEDYLA